MKKFYFIILILFSAGFSFASIPDTIPNAGFERWLTVTWFDYPEAWMTNNNSLMAPGVVVDSDSYSGNLAVKVANAGALVPHLWTGFSLNTRPFNLGGYYKKNVLANDSVIISVRLYYNQIVVDSGYSVEYAGSTSGYVPFIIPISQNLAVADSCNISIEGGTVFTSGISFDDLEFDFSLGFQPVNDFNFSLYPNPCIDKIVVRSNFSEKNEFTIEAYDIIGKKVVLNELLLDNSNEEGYIVNPTVVRMVYDISQLHSGMWILVYKSKRQTYAARIVKS
jgi:hypothetical protein